MPEKDGDEGKSTKSVVNKKQKQMMGEEQFSDKQRSDMKDILNKNFGSEDKSKETAGKLIKDKAKKDVERVQSGKQPNKSTPSTKLGRSSVDLNKYFGEEGYDIARDMGKVRPSKDKKDATTMPPSKEMKKTQKVNKGPSAFERVKAKYGKSVMNVGKKKVKEELDLTKVAEAFGGHIVEQEQTEYQRQQEKQQQRRKKGGPGYTGKIDPGSKEAGENILKKIKAFTNQQQELPLIADPVKDVKNVSDITGSRKLKGRPFGSKNKPKPEPSPIRQLELPVDEPEPEKEPRSARKRKSTAIEKPFATRTGESGGKLPVSMRNKRVPKTSSIVKPTVGALAKTDQQTSAITKGGIDYKALQDKIKTVSLGKGMEIVDEPKTRTQGGKIGKDTGRTVIGQVIPDKPTKTDTKTDTETKLLPPSSKPDLTKLLDPKKKKFPINPQSFRKEPTPEEKPNTENQTDSGTGGTRPPRKITKTYGPGGPKKPFTPIKSAREFARKDPVAALGAYDLGKGILGKIMKTRLPSLQAKSGFRSAKGGGGL